MKFSTEFLDAIERLSTHIDELEAEHKAYIKQNRNVIKHYINSKEELVLLEEIRAHLRDEILKQRTEDKKDEVVTELLNAAQSHA